MNNNKLKINSQPSTLNSQLNKGFTLVELLVVATLIGLLASIGISGYQAVTRSGRDALRKSEIEQIRSALEIYKAENGLYPADDDNCQVSAVIIPAFFPDYMASFPQDPKSPTFKYCYNQISNLTYEVCVHLENDTSGNDYCGGPNNCGDGDDVDDNCNYRMQNP